MTIKYNSEYIAENVYRLRKEKLNMSQERFGEIVDLSKDTISNIERGRYRPNLETLINISNATNVALDYFLSEQEG